MPDRHPKDELPILQFPDQPAWELWLENNHDSEAGVWLRIAKKASPHATVTYPDVLDTALCFGWIDGQRHPHDDSFFLQRFTPRGPRSKWSKINREKVERLIAQARMRPAGLAKVDAAKQDGRWDAAYEPQGAATVPADFQQELDRNPEAKAFFETLRGTNRYAFLYRISDARRPETRAGRIAKFVQMLNDHQTFYP
jgi:uncharacterized protein YdeI (YjbR/CyaY-like superfamily)